MPNKRPNKDESGKDEEQVNADPAYGEYLR